MKDTAPKILYIVILIIAMYFALKIFLASIFWVLGSLSVIAALVFGVYFYFKKSKK